MLRGYARVSTVEQNLDRQIIALQEAGCEKIYQEKITGTTKDRTELQRLLAELEEGDTVIVKELTRVSRSTLDMLDLVQQITEKGCFIRSLSESWLDTGSPTGELMLTLMAGIAQFERRLLLQRCAEGRAVAVAKGTKMGRPRTGGKQLDFAIELYKNKSMSIRKICESTGIAKATLCRRLKELGLTTQSA
ncbi:recombinase family protein [Clostridium magnum]|uniref:Transposon gamma-delta resolvase n=1 Tax=Clostridium magnum DSM 2767 TaxID=1121326 RepID=A0A161YI09_9CLOT|nr:recombinase family protein [Clostridium magnum]KZL89942.1 transposon gamma-delta resolvase [Clostridium magnum DSM 2767]SHJ33501.1 Site-specific DNA recombinase [Clostridium magnum DSM 2767]